MRLMGNAVEHFAIPGLAPKPVQDASDKFEKFTADYQATRANYYALKTSRLDDIAAANLAAAEARVEGGKPPALTPDKIDANIAKVEQEMNVLHEATDLAHTALMEAIEEHREVWLAHLDEVERASVERLRAVLNEARAAISDLQLARTAPEWLRAFRVSASQSQWTGGRALRNAGLDNLERLVEPEQRLVGYRDDDGDGVAEPVFEDVIA